jgi:ABC-2 type transport system ATP-binding protein
MTPSLETRELTRRFGEFVAVDSLNLDIRGTKVVGFLGPNGAGKTTSLKMMTDLIYPTSGEALLNGVSVQRERKRALADVGTLIETPEIYPSLTPREALELSGAVRGLPARTIRARTDEVLAEVKMTEWADAKVGRFSKGMKQRINLAAALLSDPSVVLLDEPSTGLDPRGMAEVRSIVKGLKRGDRLVFMSSHILSEVVDVCDEVALVDHGRLLFHEPLERVAARLGGVVPDVELAFLQPIDDATVRSTIAPIAGVTAWERAGPDRLTLKLTGGAEAQARVLQAIAAAGIGLKSFHESRSALEEVYLREIARGEA